MAGANKRRIIVHLGVQKTGSTAFHHLLNRNALALSDRLVVRTPEAGTPMRPLGRAAIAYSLKPGKGNAQTLRDAITVIREGLPDDGRAILISHENLAGAMPGNGGETGLFPALPQIVALLDKVLRKIGKPHFVLTTRDFTTWKPSVWAQAVRSDGYTASYEGFLADTAALPGWDDLTARLKAEIGGARLSVFPIEDNPDPGRPGSAILALAGLSGDEIAALEPVPRPVMARLNDGATEFLRQLNGLQLNPHPRARVADLVARSQHLFTADIRPQGTP